MESANFSQLCLITDLMTNKNGFTEEKARQFFFFVMNLLVEKVLLRILCDVQSNWLILETVEK